MALKIRYVWLVVLLLTGCTEHLYKEGIEATYWPLAGEKRYSLRLGPDAQVHLFDHRSNRESPLPFYTRKLSTPVIEHIRFSRDGRLLMVPTRNTFILDKSPLKLKVWDIEGNRLLKTISIDEDLFLTRSKGAAQETRDEAANP